MERAGLMLSFWRDCEVWQALGLRPKEDKKEESVVRTDISLPALPLSCPSVSSVQLPVNDATQYIDFH